MGNLSEFTLLELQALINAIKAGSDKDQRRLSKVLSKLERERMSRPWPERMLHQN